MGKRPITLRTPEAWVVQQDDEKFHVAVQGKSFYPTSCFRDACEMVKKVNCFFDCLQKVQDWIDDLDRKGRT